MHLTDRQFGGHSRRESQIIDSSDKESTRRRKSLSRQSQWRRRQVLNLQLFLIRRVSNIPVSPDENCRTFQTTPAPQKNHPRQNQCPGEPCCRLRPHSFESQRAALGKCAVFFEATSPFPVNNGVRPGLFCQ